MTIQIAVVEEVKPSALERRREFFGSAAIGLILVVGLATPVWVGMLAWNIYKMTRLVTG